MEIITSITTVGMYFSARSPYPPKEAMPNLQYAIVLVQMPSGSGPTRSIRSVMARLFTAHGTLSFVGLWLEIHPLKIHERRWPNTSINSLINYTFNRRGVRLLAQDFGVYQVI
jgi:hypothetical protein